MHKPRQKAASLTAANIASPRQFITNGLNTTIPKGGMKVSIWANKTEIAGCNEGGPTAEYDLPDIKPLATYELKVSYKVGDALGPIVTRVFVDSGCQVGGRTGRCTPRGAARRRAPSAPEWSPRSQCGSRHAP